ncbi:AbrB/MazE/SpoVT family DNA-binding domain-containing protein [Patescibacteria group bacterium]
MRRSLEERNVRKISKSGSSYSITLPIEFVRELKWREGQKVVVSKERGKLIIKDWKK